MGVLAGIVAGAAVGQMWLGWVGVILGAVAGVFASRILGRVPYAIAREMLKRNLRRRDVATLRSSLDREYYISHLIIAELVTRGEPIEFFKAYVSGLLRSDSGDRGRFGEQVLRIWPETIGSTDSHK